MSLLKLPQNTPIKLRLARNLTRNIKRGHPWVFADALRDCPPAPPGTHAILLDNKKGTPIARGFYSSTGPLAFRVCTTQPGQPLSNEWAERRMARALALRQTLFGSGTTGYRLFNGEGDGLPGLVCDVYGDSAVIQLDGAAPTAFWNATAIGRWVAHQLDLRRVYQKAQSRKIGGSRALVGSVPAAPVPFLENGVHFTVDLVHGQKTGFFLDQRDNRQQIGRIAAGLETLNVFGYTGGFSVMAGLGGASRVTTVDLAGPALKTADHHWHLNHLPADRHQSIKADAFKFLAGAADKNRQWPLVIVDPPSFASSKNAVVQATTAYQKLIAAAARVTVANGMLAAASCSSHITPAMFTDICQQAISQARRTATVLTVGGQAPDHPTPLAFPEFRYLNFILLRVE